MEAVYLNEITLRDRVTQRLKDMVMNKAELALRINYSRSAVSQYLNGKYNSDAKDLETALEKFLIDSAPDETDLKVVKNIIPDKKECFENKDYINILGICNACQEDMGLGLIVGKSGYGKTYALCKYAELPRVAYIECNETMNCKDMIRKIEAAVGLPKSSGSIDERLEHVKNFFNLNRGYLLIVDEADKLISKYTQKKIEMLRYIFDGADVGIIIAGELSLESMMKSYDQRLANRMDFYYRLSGLNRDEILKYLESYTIEEQAIQELVTRANNTHSGCFRLLDRTLNNVIRILKNSGRTEITMKVIREASDMMML